MEEHRFTLRFDVTAIGVGPYDVVELLGASGCDDAIVGIGRAGRVALAFDREAGGAMEAVSSAIRDVKRALPGAVLLEAAPDLVGVTDLADIVGRTRQNMRKLLLSRGTSAPAAVHESSSSMWHLATVLVWLRDEKSYPIRDELLDVARTTLQVNLAIDRGHLDGSMQREIAALLA
jgi:hypothetical protein